MVVRPRASPTESRNEVVQFRTRRVGYLAVIRVHPVAAEHQHVTGMAHIYLQRRNPRCRISFAEAENGRQLAREAHPPSRAGLDVELRRRKVVEWQCAAAFTARAAHASSGIVEQAPLLCVPRLPQRNGGIARHRIIVGDLATDFPEGAAGREEGVLVGKFELLDDAELELGRKAQKRCRGCSYRHGAGRDGILKCPYRLHM